MMAPGVHSEKDRILSALDAVLKDPPADRVEMFVGRRSGGYARCARSRIHQSAEESGVSVSVRAALGRKVGVAFTNSLTTDGLGRALNQAVDAARVSPEAEYLGPPVEPWNAPEGVVDGETASFGAGDRAEALSSVFELAEAEAQTVAGIFGTWVEERAAATTSGLRAFSARTLAETSLIAEGEREGNYTPSGYAHGIAPRAAELDLAGLAGRRWRRCAQSVSPRTLEPGDYTVLLEPPCVAEVLEWMSSSGSARRPTWTAAGS